MPLATIRQLPSGLTDHQLYKATKHQKAKAPLTAWWLSTVEMLLGLEVVFCIALSWILTRNPCAGMPRPYWRLMLHFRLPEVAMKYGGWSLLWWQWRSLMRWLYPGMSGGSKGRSVCLGLVVDVCQMPALLRSGQAQGWRAQTWFGWVGGCEFAPPSSHGRQVLGSQLMGKVWRFIGIFACLLWGPVAAWYLDFLTYGFQSIETLPESCYFTTLSTRVVSETHGQVEASRCWRRFWWKPKGSSCCRSRSKVPKNVCFNCKPRKGRDTFLNNVLLMNKCIFCLNVFLSLGRCH